MIKIQSRFVSSARKSVNCFTSLLNVGYEVIDFSATESQAQGLCFAKQMKVVDIDEDTKRMYLMSSAMKEDDVYWIANNFYVVNAMLYSKLKFVKSCAQFTIHRNFIFHQEWTPRMTPDSAVTKGPVIFLNLLIITILLLLLLLLLSLIDIFPVQNKMWFFLQ